MTTADGALLAGLFGVIMGLIELAKFLAGKRANGKSKESAVPPTPILVPAQAADECRDCRRAVFESTHNILELREENQKMQNHHDQEIQVLNRMADGISTLVALHQGPGRTGEFPIMKP